jgi:translation initiation factor IF-2
MAMLTVDDLARDLRVRNEDLVRELITMGYEVDGPESPLETDDPAALRAELVNALPRQEVIEKRIKPTVIRRRIKKKPPEETPREEVLEPIAARPAELPESVSFQDVSAAGQARGQEHTRPAAPKKTVRKLPRVEPARIIEKAPPRPLEVIAPPPQAEAEIYPPEARQPALEVEPAITPEPPVGISGVFTAPQAAESPAEQHYAITEEAASPADDDKSLDDKLGRKKKKRDKRMQPAQIIGKVELKRERVFEPAAIREYTPPAREHTPRPMAPAAPAPVRQPVAVEIPAADDKRPKRLKDKKAVDEAPARLDQDKGTVRRRKEVILRDELYDERQRNLRIRGKGRKVVQRKTEITVPKAIKRRVKLPVALTVAELAHKVSVKAAEVIQRLISMGTVAAMNDKIDFETASLLATEFGFEAESSEHTEQGLLPADVSDTAENLIHRPPVVTIMGHVDHGKTSLLDFIRSTHVTAQEAGGITQHIGAYKVKLDKGEIVFLDTPGHEAFTAMRARGAQVTDFVIIVVAADDGVKEQTKEAINHARAAGVPIVVAINKIDKPEADLDRVVRELSEQELIPEEWGGETLFTRVSAKTGQGVNEFLEAILLQAEIMELTANPGRSAMGSIIEARLDKGKGPVATVLVKHGTLRLGDAFVSGAYFGKVRAMLDHEGAPVKEAGPSTPVEVHGFSGVPEAGESFVVVDDEKIARQIWEHRHEALKMKQVPAAGPMSVEEIMAKMKEQESTKDLNLIIKADVQGSAEALKEALVGLSGEEVQVKIIHDGVGTVTESDVMLASASKAMVIGFNVRPTPKTTQVADAQKVDIRLYTIIYEAIEDIRKAASNMLAPIEKETVTGRAEVRQTFSIAKIGVVAGCHVVSGKIQRSNNVRLLRDNVVIHNGKMASLKRFKDDVKEVQEGYECGIMLDNFKDVKVGDVIEGYTVEFEPGKLT